MLNMISSNETAENAAAIFAAALPRPRYGPGASALVTATTPASARVAISARPCTTDAAVAAAHVILAAAGLDDSKQLLSEQPVFMTRTSAAGGGALGPHTAREPV